MLPFEVSPWTNSYGMDKMEVWEVATKGYTAVSSKLRGHFRGDPAVSGAT